MHKIISFIFISTIFFSSCNNTEQKKLIVGKWKCAEWLVKGENQLSENTNVSFQFLEDGKYAYNNQSLNEKGTYKIQGGRLYSTPDNELEIAVDIEKLTADTLIFNMSRAGVPETMLLIKEKL